MTKLREIRQARNLSQYRVAKMLGMTESHLSKWETGKVEPSPKSLLKLARFYGVTVDDLLNGSDVSRTQAAAV